MNSRASADAIDALLPQTQCTRCGYPDCRSYAEAIADGSAAINRCPPGGAESIGRLAALTGAAVLPLDAGCGSESPRAVARIDEDWCIGCTLCLAACPVDAIVGAHKRMHTVIGEACNGCELCLPACPVDCILMLPATGTATGWAAWSQARADDSRARHARHRLRVEHQTAAQDARRDADAQSVLSDIAAHSRHTDAEVLERKRTLIEAALARAQARRQAAASTPAAAADDNAVPVAAQPSNDAC